MTRLKHEIANAIRAHFYALEEQHHLMHVATTLATKSGYAAMGTELSDGTYLDIRISRTRPEDASE